MGTLGHVKTHHVLLRTTRAEPTRVKQRARRLSTHRPGTQITIRAYEQRPSPVREWILAKVPVLKETEKGNRQCSAEAMRVSRNGYRTAHTGVDIVVKVSGGNVHDALLVWRGSSLVVERHLDTAQGTLEGLHLRRPRIPTLATHIARDDTTAYACLSTVFVPTVRNPSLAQRQPPSTARCTRK